jgi:hypothetical protein
MMMGVEISVVGVSYGPRASAPRSKMVVSSGFWSGIFSYDLVASKDPSWYRFHLCGGRGGSSVIGDRPRSLCD